MDPALYDSKGVRRTIACGPNQPFETWRRTVFSGESCTIYAWPCRGGVIIKENPDIVDMNFLGFDRFSPPAHRFPDEQQDKEDRFARQLLKVGGKLWSSQQRYANVGAGWKEPEGEERMCKFFGWDPPDESGGVWVLEFDVDDEEPPETARLRMALTMKERCTIMEKLGAKFYKDPTDYEGLRGAYTSLHSPIQ